MLALKSRSKASERGRMLPSIRGCDAMLTAAITAPKISFETFAMTFSPRLSEHAASPQIPSHFSYDAEPVLC